MIVSSRIGATVTMFLITITASQPVYPIAGTNITKTIHQNSECNEIHIPAMLCTTCRMRTFKVTPKGPDFNRKSEYDIYDLTTPSCMAKLYKYIQINPCDYKRSQAVHDLMKSKRVRESRDTLSYFMYSICETCCDCISIGARVEQYESRKARNNLINTRRGNCAAHFAVDVCNIWPEVNHIVGGPASSIWPGNGKWKYCKEFRDWWGSPRASGWEGANNQGGTSPRMQRALKQITKSNYCEEKRQWMDCVRFERALGRI